eukprot:2866755-Lingulodinium_polyedra.AAC.1
MLRMLYDVNDASGINGTHGLRAANIVNGARDANVANAAPRVNAVNGVDHATEIHDALGGTGRRWYDMMHDV